MALNIYILTLNMLLNISYNDIKQKKEIDKLVGKPFSIKERATVFATSFLPLVIAFPKSLVKCFLKSLGISSKVAAYNG